MLRGKVDRRRCDVLALALDGVRHAHRLDMPSGTFVAFDATSAILCQVSSLEAMKTATCRSE